MALQGIRAVPQGAAPELRGLLTDMRTRLLALNQPFTDAEIASLRALLRNGSGSTTTTTVVNQTAAQVFIEPYAFYDGPGFGSWTEFNAHDANVPDGASAIIVNALYGNNNGAQGGFAVQYRAADGAPVYNLLYGHRDKDDPSSGSQQGVYPIGKDGKFSVIFSGNTLHGSGSCNLSIYGYVMGGA